MMLSKRTTDDIVRYKQKIGCLIQIPNIGRGQLKFVGTVANKPGYYAGVDLLAPIGKNDGTFSGRRYFSTEYPKSGLFIQLPKIAHIIDEAEAPDAVPSSARKSLGSRRSTLGGHGEGLGSARRISGGSVERSSLRRTQSPHVASINRPDNNVRTPTPTRNINMAQRVSSIERHAMTNNSKSNLRNNDDIDMEMGGTTPERANYNTFENNNVNESSSQQQASNEQSLQLIKEYELKLEKQNRKLLEYERLLNDQRIVLEEIQPTIDEYDKRVNDLELERNMLKEKSQESQAEFDKQLKYFETENKQLTEVVSQLHEDLRSNEEYIKNQAASAANVANADGLDLNALQSQLEELTKYKQDMENAQIKWNKEKDQLKMHNESLSKEYQNLNKEYMMSLSSGNDNTSNDNDKDEIIKENEALKNELQLLKDQISRMESASHSIPPYIPPAKVDATAGRELWCSLCEKSGHDQIDCPYQYETSNRPYKGNKDEIATSKEMSESQQYF